MAFGTTPSNGTEYALWNQSPARKVRGALWGGKRRYGSNAAITLAAGGQINLLRLSIGDVVMGGRIYWEALGSSVQIWLGDAGDCDRYKTQSNGAVANSPIVAAAGAVGDCTLFNNIAGIGFAVTAGNEDVTLTNSYGAATSALTAGQIKVVLELGTE